jgi:SAM-dependent methyltransferase
MPADYSPDAVRAYFDEYGEREWDRLERRPMDLVSLELHRRLQTRIVRRGDRVLEVGAGPGRFTIQLAELGASVTVVDISPHQLDLNRERVTAAGREAAVVDRQLADLTDLSRFEDGAFDVVTAFGGPLSYLFGRAGEGLDQMLLKARPGGTVAFSVMSLWGALRMALPDVLGFDRQGLGDLNARVIETGDLTGAIASVAGMSVPHECHLFTWAEVETLIAARPCELIEASASNYLSVNLGEVLQASDGALWERFVDWEERACHAAGVLDAGTHIIAALRKM